MECNSKRSEKYVFCCEIFLAQKSNHIYCIPLLIAALSYRLIRNQLLLLRWCDVTCIMHCGGVSKHVLTPEIDPGPAGCAETDG